MLVVVAVIAILTAILLIDYGSIKQQLALRRAANQFGQDIRATQGLALGATEHPCGNNQEIKADGFGICVGINCDDNSGKGCKSNNCYIIYARCNNNPSKKFDFDGTSGGEGRIHDDILRTVYLESGLSICIRPDSNCDGNVNILDLLDIRENYKSGCVPPAYCLGKDVNRDGNVNILDLINVRDNSNKKQSTVVFEFPGPTTNFGGVPSYSPPDSDEVLQDFRIIINNSPAKARNVSVNSAGLIEIK